MARSAKQKSTGIKAGEVLPTEEFKSRMGWGQKAWVAARRRGLPTRKSGQRIFVVTDEAIEWLTSQPATA